MKMIKINMIMRMEIYKEINRKIINIVKIMITKLIKINKKNLKMRKNNQKI